MRILMAVVAWALIGCSSAQIHINRAALATSTAGLVCDWGYTHRSAEQGWGDLYEKNPIMGPTPSTGVVNAYFLSALAINTAAWILTPTTYRAALPIAVTARQSLAIARNNETLGSVCGF